MTDHCSGGHRFFVAETVMVESTGTLHVVTVCTACGEPKVSNCKLFNPSEGSPKNKITQLSKGNS